MSLCRYLDDFYELELQVQSGVKGWNIPETKGGGPSARESHSSVVYCGKGGSGPKLYIFGGMCGHRLNDLWQLDIGKALFIFIKITALYDLFILVHLVLAYVFINFRDYDLVITSNQRSAATTQESAHLQCDWKQVKP